MCSFMRWVAAVVAEAPLETVGVVAAAAEAAADKATITQVWQRRLSCLTASNQNWQSIPIFSLALINV